MDRSGTAFLRVLDKSLQDMEEAVDHEQHTRADARTELIADHLSYADRVSRIFYFQNTRGAVDYDELQSAAFLGLCDAAQRYDGTRGQSFETFSYLRIRGAMFDFLRRAAPASRSLLPWLSRDGKEKPCAGEGERYIPQTLAELAGILDVLEEVNVRVCIDDEQSLVELAYVADQSPESAAQDASLGRYMKKLLSRLPEREARILELHYFRGHSFEDMRSEFDGASRSWLCRIHQRALERLRTFIQADSRECERRADSLLPERGAS